MARWFLIKDKQKLGPYAAAEMRRLAVAGQLQPADMVLREGEQRWVEARVVKGLLPATPAAATAVANPSKRSSLLRRPAFWLVLLFLIPSVACAWFFLEARGMMARLAERDGKTSVANLPDKELAALALKFEEQTRKLNEITRLAGEQKETIARLEARLAKDKEAPPAKTEPAARPPEPQVKNAPAPYAEIDKHALAAPREAEKTLASLARYLTAPADSDLLKARAIFRWITDRITYDLDSFRAKKMPDFLPEAVLAARTSVCEGYARLFEALCKKSGVEVALIHGYGKTLGFVGPDGSNRISHTWNAVKLDGRWRLLDTTWAAGFVNNGAFLKKLNDFYFLTPAREFIYTHLPTDSKWQLLDMPVSAEEFDRQPLVPPDLFRIGVTVDEVEQRLHSKSFLGFVKTFVHTPLITLRKGPLEGTLRKGTTYHFAMECPNVTALAFFSNSQFAANLVKEGSLYQGSIEPAAGTLHVGVRTADSGNRFNFVLEYRVE